MGYRANKVDRRYNDWHYSLSKRCEYMDLDGVEFNQSRDALLLLEVTSNPEKYTTVLRRLAQKAGLPAVLVMIPPAPEPLLSTTEIIVTVVWCPPETNAPPHGRMTLSAWGEYLEQLHAE